MTSKIKLSEKEFVDNLIDAINKLPKRQKEDFIEDLLTATSPEYISSAKEARADYKAGKTSTHDELFF